MPQTAAVGGVNLLDELEDTELCEDCEEVVSHYFCNACQVSLCAECWDAQPAHRRKRLAPGQIPHEKTGLLLANRVQTVFSCSGDERTLRRLHREDEITAWFGLERELKDNRPFMFRDHGRFADLATSSHQHLFRKRGFPYADANRLDTHCVPSLVSFVGQTGAGKSTLIKLLVKFNSTTGQDAAFQTPVPGITGRDLPTSEDVHLYADPLTAGSEHPLLFADSEGLDGGEREPLAASYRKTREKEEMDSMGSESDYSATPRDYTEREVSWMDSKIKRTRQFAAGQLYPRILFAFSDVVVFVHRNPRAIEGVLERLLDWGSVAIETTYNQPILPYAILALNATESDIDPQMWDVDISTRLLLESLSETIDRNVTFSNYAELWRKRGKKIETVEDLMLCYYSALRIIRIPTSGRPKLVEEQGHKLYLDIERGCRLARNTKAQTRMLLNAFEFQAYLNHAFDHFCSTIDTPFDFVECSYLTSRLSTTFGESVLALAVEMAKTKPRPRVSAIFEKLGRLIASCIMMDTLRNNLKGTAERIFAQYVPQIDAALKEFGDRYWPCEFYVQGAVPPHLQAHLSNLAFQQSVRAAAVIMRCANVRSGHAAKGHQLSDGRVFARGSYQSSFFYETNRKEILDDIFMSFHQFMSKLSQMVRQDINQLTAASIIHRDDALAAYYPYNEDSELGGMRYTSFCICCLFGIPEALMPCGHMLCRECIQVYGRKKGQILIDVLECPLEVKQNTRPHSRSVYLRPDAAGVRVLALKNGGIRSIIQIEILKLIEKELHGKIPVQSFFDMIIGEGTGGVIALGLSARGWDLNDCEQHICSLFDKIFTRANQHRFPTLQIKAAHVKYRSKPLDDSISAMFPDQRIVDLSRTTHPVQQSSKVAVLAASATGRKILFSNYQRKASSKLPYALYPTTDYVSQPQVANIARASMAHTDLFKPYIDSRLGQLYFKTDMSEGFLIEVAQNECQAIYTNQFPDVLLSLGCGKSKRPPVPSIASNETKRTKVSSRNTLRTDHDDSISYITDDSLEAFAHYPRPNFISLNPTLESLPELDDMASIPVLQNLIRNSIDAEVITKLVSQLFATLFYAETSAPVEDTAAGEILIPIRIYCRLLDHTTEIQEVGNLLKTGPFRKSEFVFWEEGYGAQQFPIVPGRIDRMIRELQFPVLKLLMPLWQRDAVVHAILKLETGEEYSISGFPRRLGSTVTHRLAPKTELDVVGQAKLPTWTAPNLEGSGSSGFWSSALPLRSSSLQQPLGASDLSDEPGPAEYAEVPSYEDIEEHVTALPKYTR